MSPWGPAMLLSVARPRLPAGGSGNAGLMAEPRVLCKADVQEGLTKAAVAGVRDGEMARKALSE